MHYNEFKVVEFARKLIKADEEALENEDDNRPSSSKSNAQNSYFSYLYQKIHMFKL